MFILYIENNKEVSMLSFPQEKQCYDFVIKTSASRYKILPMQNAKDAYFLSCLEWDVKENDFVVNFQKAKLQTLFNIRMARHQMFTTLDIEYMKALEQNNQEKLLMLASLKQQLRDVTTLELPNNIEQLKNFVPQVFLDFKLLNL
jgi:hypothetical protein